MQPTVDFESDEVFDTVSSLNGASANQIPKSATTGSIASSTQTPKLTKTAHCDEFITPETNGRPRVSSTTGLTPYYKTPLSVSKVHILNYSHFVIGKRNVLKWFKSKEPSFLREINAVR